MEEKQLYTINVYTENQVGLLSQISIIFTRRKLNVESLSVSASALEGIHKFTITTYCERSMVEKVVQQIEKKIDVVKAFFFLDDEIVFQEIALYKVSTEKLLDDNRIEEIVRSYSARILEVTRDYTVIEKSGHTNETQALFDELSKVGVLQFVRSGRVAITKSTKERVSLFLSEQEKRRGIKTNA